MGLPATAAVADMPVGAPPPRSSPPIVVVPPIVVDTSTETVLRHARAQAPNDTALAIQQHVLTVLLGAT